MCQMISNRRRIGKPQPDGKRRWRARAPRPVGAPVAGMEREASWSAERSSALESGAGARALQDLSAPRLRGWNAKRLGVRNAVPLWKAALARARFTTCRRPGCGDGTRSVLECGTQFRFGKRRWRARGPRPVGAPVAGMERESVLECGTQFRLGKRRWRARAPRPVGAPVAGMERESVLECGTQFRLGKRRWRARAPRPAGISDAPGETRKRLGVSRLRARAERGTLTATYDAD